MLAEHERWDFEIRENYAGKWMLEPVLRVVLFGFLEYSFVYGRSLVSMGLILFRIMQAFALVELVKSYGKSLSICINCLSEKIRIFRKRIVRIAYYWRN